MTALGSDYEVAIVGGGPVGCVAAAALARRGARVLLLEASPKAAARFAGEWIHPPGHDVLRELDLAPARARSEACRGFAVFPDDGSEPIRLPYADGAIGLSGEHSELVGEIRRRVADLPNVDYRPFTRVTAIDDRSVTIARRGEAEQRVRVDRVVGADGRSSIVRKSLGGPDHAVPVSHMAGVLLDDVELPFEGHGHVLLGGPGPVLLYRIGPGRARACLDIPVDHPRARRDASFLWQAFAPVFPAALRPAFRRALTERRVAWAHNRFRPRTFYGRGRAALVGDAVGFFHPMTAAGMTTGFLDAVRYAEADSVEEFAARREQESYVPELLANALYQVFVRDDASAAEVRSSVYRVWRRSAAERERTMKILAGSERSLRQFGGAFVTVALDAARRSAGRGFDASGPVGATRGVARLAEWARWPLATALPRPVRASQRPASSCASPLADGGRAVNDAGALPILADDTLETGLADIRATLGDAPLRPPEDPAKIALREVSGATPSGRAARELLAAQQPDGGFGDVEHTARSVSALVGAGLPTYHPAVRRAVRRVLADQRSDGRFERLGEYASVTTARVLRDLLAVDAPNLDALDGAGAFVLSQLPRGRADLLECGLALEALRRHRAARLLARPASERPRATVPTKALDAPTPGDWDFCKESLLEVSRTFARPIEMLPGKLEVAVTCGYLLCRVADTVEDNPNLSIEQRDARYAAFLDVMERGAAPDTFARLWDDVEGRPSELHLCKNLERVLRVFNDLPRGMRDKTTRWVVEMTRGMQLYSHRPAGDDGITALYTVEDLDRYCYFVAGTVGHMLTDLFLEELGEGAGPGVELALREQAEAFGVGLQLVNILKDVTDDAERRWSFVPRTAAARQQLAIGELLDPEKRERAHAAVRPLFAEARRRLDRALEYTLAIPSDHGRVRLFCLLPLWMAVRTLVHAEGNDAMFEAGEPVKISRAEVEQLIGECVRHVQEDDALRDQYQALWTLEPQPTLTAASVH